MRKYSISFDGSDINICNMKSYNHFINLLNRRIAQSKVIEYDLNSNHYLLFHGDYFSICIINGDKIIEITFNTKDYLNIKEGVELIDLKSRINKLKKI